ncbi:hypothetical protein GIB67_001043 [Kingdonia uniflora]|uniref:G10 protein n=1 Tax=Kingdonia uniflora TaxID=39325 RepID=A0A7J7MG97_9MAGN|nr:hypothetical protein GIB67_001043 [Kingdonia uniflora]
MKSENESGAFTLGTRAVAVALSCPRRVEEVKILEMASTISFPPILQAAGFLLAQMELGDPPENDENDGKRKCEALWPIFRIAHQKSRYIYDLYYRRKEISKELYEFCLDQGHADRNIIAKWKKPGYERLCCLRCIQPRDHNFATTCVCRVPKHLREEKVIECVHCGCRGCASGD